MLTRLLRWKGFALLLAATVYWLIIELRKIWFVLLTLLGLCTVPSTLKNELEPKSTSLRLLSVAFGVLLSSFRI